MKGKIIVAILICLALVSVVGAGSITKHTIGSQVDADGVQLADFDNDGDMDVINSGGDSGDAPLFIQNNLTNWSKYTILSGYSELEGIDATDIDSDGKTEVFLLDQGATDSAGNKLYIAKQDTSDPTGSWSDTILDSNADDTQCSLITDVDNDGDEDIIYTVEDKSAGGNSGVYWQEYLGGDPMDSANWTKHTIEQIPGAWWVVQKRKDLSGDGNATDIVVTARESNPDATGELFWLEPPANVENTWTHHTINLTPGYNPSSVSMGELNGYGDAKDIVLNFNNKVYVYNYSNDWSREQILNVGEHISNVKATNLYHTERDQLVVSWFDSSILKFYNYTGTGWEVFDSTFYAYCDDRIIEYDLTGDGFNELVSSGANSETVDWFETDASSSENKSSENKPSENKLETNNTEAGSMVYPFIDEDPENDSLLSTYYGQHGDFWFNDDSTFKFNNSTCNRFGFSTVINGSENLIDTNAANIPADFERFYTFDDSGAWDSIGNNNGTFQGSPTTGEPGQVKYGIEFDGSNDYIEFTQTEGTAFGDYTQENFTIALWSNFSGVSDGDKDADFRMQANNRMGMWVNTTGYYIGSYQNSSGTQRRVVSTVSNDVWNMWAFSFNWTDSGITIKLYKNGQLVDTTSASDDAMGDNPSYDKDTIGAHPSPANYKDGVIDDFRFYSSVKSQDFVGGLYNATKPVAGYDPTFGVEESITEAICGYTPGTGDWIVDTPSVCKQDVQVDAGHKLICEATLTMYNAKVTADGFESRTTVPLVCAGSGVCAVFT